MKDLVVELRASCSWCRPCKDCQCLFDEAADEIERLHTWDGLLSILDEHYPPDMIDGSSGETGPRLVTMAREIERLRAFVAEQPCKCYDEYGKRKPSPCEGCQLLYRCETWEEFKQALRGSES